MMVTANDVVLRDIQDNSFGQLQFSMFVQTGDGTVLQGDTLQMAVQVYIWKARAFFLTQFY